jgi:hypothetical protein
MEPYSFAQTFPFIPPEVLCDVREFHLFSWLGPVWSILRRFQSWI